MMPIPKTVVPGDFVLEDWNSDTSPSSIDATLRQSRLGVSIGDHLVPVVFYPARLAEVISDSLLAVALIKLSKISMSWTRAFRIGSTFRRWCLAKRQARSIDPIPGRLTE